MRILVVGDGHSQIHEVAVARAFRELGHSVEEFHWSGYFRAEGRIRLALARAQNKFLVGPRVNRINRDLIAIAARFRPNLIFIYRGTHVVPAAIEALRQNAPHCKIFGYNNDNPFAPGHPKYLWRNFTSCVPLYDAVFSYRHGNIEQLRKIGARRVELLRSWFVPWLNYPVSLERDEHEQYDADIVFVGHYERDQRTNCLERIVRQGWKLRLFGPGYDWDPVIRESPVLSTLAPVRLVWGKDYSAALSGARIALCFLSKLNQDTYTRRCFEIPATRTLMLAEYSEDLAALFREGEEVDFFRSPDEMMEKIELYMNNETRRKTVAESGFRRVHDDGHDVVSRMRQVLDLAGRN